MALGSILYRSWRCLARSDGAAFGIDSTSTAAGRDVGRERQSPRERRATTLALASRLDGSAMQLGQMSRNRQAKAESAVLPRVGPIGLSELVEHERDERGRDPDACVGDRQLRIRAVGSDGNRYAAVL